MNSNKDKINSLRSRLLVLEWDKKHNRSSAKDHIYDELKSRYDELVKCD